MNKILLVEDDKAITDSLKEFLNGEGFAVSSTSSCSDAISILRSENISLVLLDIALSDGSGFRVCPAAKELDVPVIFLTASGDENSVVMGLDMGADDYIAKPFRPRELISRINNVLRRYASSGRNIMLGSIMVDTDKGQVFRKADNNALNEIQLTALEYRLLLIFINNRGILLSRDKLLEDIWDIAGDFVNDNTLTVYIKRLREKIENDPQKPEIIKTVRGLGYRMD